MRSRTDYILGTDHHLFHFFSVQDPRHNMDHYLVLGRLCNATLREHHCYLMTCTRIPLRPDRQPYRKDTIFTYLWKEATQFLARERPNNTWISNDTWQVIYASVSLRRDLYRYQRRICDLGHRVWALLYRERHKCTEEAETTV